MKTDEYLNQALIFKLSSVFLGQFNGCLAGMTAGDAGSSGVMTQIFVQHPLIRIDCINENHYY